MNKSKQIQTNTLYNARRYAYWIYLGDDKFKCSNCGARYRNVDNKSKCPACRAEIINSLKEGDEYGNL